MNKEKLINIILKDIEELKEIAEEIEKGGSGAKLETDIALSKATLVLQELQLLKEKYIVGNHQPVVKEVINPVLSELEPVEEPEKEQSEAHITFEVAEEQAPEDEFTEGMHEPILILDEEAKGEYGVPEEENGNSDGEEDDEAVPEGDDDGSVGDDDGSVGDDDGSVGEDDASVGDDDGSVGDDDGSVGDDDDSEGDDDGSEGDDDDSEGDDDISEEEDGDSDEDDEEFDEDEDFEEENEDEDGFEEEEDDLPQAGKTVGENFHRERSVNDMMGNKKHSNDTLDQKFAHGPISSLQLAIDINDRFLFIREMFNNDAQLYATAIKRLDSCADIREAVEYLSSNFRIKKTETSLKFVELIKRRFAK
ncbi:MAG: hypothetical protein A2W92_14375 [Bacteroidetes bacterium GWA2_42_15]|nr:MAG: hypothetical protein A2W92_14375 [Bacteroidetes bacterium GWA2_42_15]